MLVCSLVSELLLVLWGIISYPGDLQHGPLHCCTFERKSQACQLLCTVTDLLDIHCILPLLALPLYPFVVRFLSEPLPDWIFATLTKLTFMLRVYVYIYIYSLSPLSLLPLDYGK